MAFPMFEVCATGKEMDITRIITSSAVKGIHLTVTDSSAQASGYNYGFAIDYTNSGAKTGSAAAIGFYSGVTFTADTTYGHAVSAAIVQTDASFDDAYIACYTGYVGNMGAGASNILVADLQLAQTTAQTNSARFAFIRCRNHGSQAPNAVILCEGANAASNLIDCDANPGNGFVVAGGSGTCTIGSDGWCKLKIDVNGTTYYLPAIVSLTNS